jgi:hypothetical protein
LEWAGVLSNLADHAVERLSVEIVEQAQYSEEDTSLVFSTRHIRDEATYCKAQSLSVLSNDEKSSYLLVQSAHMCAYPKQRVRSTRIRKQVLEVRLGGGVL